MEWHEEFDHLGEGELQEWFFLCLSSRCVTQTSFYFLSPGEVNVEFWFLSVGLALLSRTPQSCVYL